ncbi:hypothetical protein M7I_4871 [Glarea lozoyensis 74030]|nr:hypothetical protein M7I_4871 [Glarea lozoyensis 74030]
MQITTFFLVALWSGIGFAVPSPDTTILTRSLGLCKSPSCTSKCPDGTPYDCCVTYVRDPCADHQKCAFMDCICECEKIPATYLCNANYFRDPCSPLHPTHPIETHTLVLPDPAAPTA